LLYYKDEIEEKLGIQLTWDRNDDKHSSRFYHEIDYLGIENEIDWLQRLLNSIRNGVIIFMMYLFLIWEMLVKKWMFIDYIML
jgi:hypothetical protein